jgi:hypothetical protein
MCEVPATVNVYTTQFSLSDGVVHIFANNPPGNFGISLSLTETSRKDGKDIK